ncbi:MAG: 23S rRNA (guanosine(2251)-2'-O)-methyltransferase RlmB [Lachnospiraceae bacterium]|nr:23S rRNA (guanosine(2251)-2'-O)-methyltransferase RlmB [Lachnospiraceae bacterium]
MRDKSTVIEGRNAVIEALRSDITVERVFILKTSTDGPVNTIIREARKQDIRIDFVDKSRLDEICPDRKHQGVAAYVAAFSYSTVFDILKISEEKGKDPFIFILDEIEDPHNLGAIIRTANMCGADGVIIPKNRAAGLTATAMKASAGAVAYTPVAKVTNLSRTIDELKEKGIWVYGLDMDGESIYRTALTGPLALVVGNEGKGISRLVKEKCDAILSIPTFGDIDSLNASVACGVVAFEALRQRIGR